MLFHELLSQDGEAVLNSFDKLLSYRARMHAAELIHIAVIDARNHFLSRGFESMKAYLMDRMDLTEDAAYKRLQVARLARQLPQLFNAVTDGRLTMKSIRLIATRLNPSNADELIDAVAHKSSREIELELARRFPQAESLRLDDGVTPQVIAPQWAEANPVAPGQPEFVKPPVAPRVPPKLKPLSATRYNLQLSLSDVIHGKLRRYQDLLSNAIPNGDLEQVIERALDAGIAQEERTKFGVGARKGKQRGSASIRSIHAHIRKAVYERDGGQCTHRYEDGDRCRKTARLEFDHIVPVAMGGKTTIDNLRLLCRAHNQHAADQAFGQAFMDRKRASRRRFYGAR